MYEVIATEETSCPDRTGVMNRRCSLTFSRVSHDLFILSFFLLLYLYILLLFSFSVFLAIQLQPFSAQCSVASEWNCSGGGSAGIETHYTVGYLISLCREPETSKVVLKSRPVIRRRDKHTGVASYPLICMHLTFFTLIKLPWNRDSHPAYREWLQISNLCCGGTCMSHPPTCVSRAWPCVCQLMGTILGCGRGEERGRDGNVRSHSHHTLRTRGPDRRRRVAQHILLPRPFSSLPFRALTSAPWARVPCDVACITSKTCSSSLASHGLPPLTRNIFISHI